jgi:hypothetical protein
LWVEFEGEDVCAGAVGDWIELSADAPTVVAEQPQTWRRAPHVLELIEVQP